MRLSLPESDRVRQRRTGGALVSVGVHVVVLATAVFASGRGEPPPPPPVKVDTTIVYLDDPPLEAPPTSGGSGGGSVERRASGPVGPSIPPFDPNVPRTGVEIEDPTPWDTPTGPIVGRDDFRVGLPGEGGRGPGGPGPDGAWDWRQVDEPVRPAQGNPAPAYPELLRVRGVEGGAVVRFVVDTLGRVEAGSVVVLRADDPLFADAVLRVVPRLRFEPARVAGRPVRQLVQQPFWFALERR